jgi:hypothetical protein
VSEANSTEHWRQKHARHLVQKNWIKAHFRMEEKPLALPIHIKLTRIAPNRLDRWDNLPMSFKYILDEICAHLVPGKAPGRADDDEINITVEYTQIASKEYGIMVEFLYNNEKMNRKKRKINYIRAKNFLRSNNINMTATITSDFGYGIQTKKISDLLSKGYKVSKPLIRYIFS